jgi:hypothetical protein
MAELLEEVNHYIRDLAAKLDPRNDSNWQFVCECGCSERVGLSLARYDALRDDGEAVLASGHHAR